MDSNSSILDLKDDESLKSITDPDPDDGQASFLQCG